MQTRSQQHQQCIILIVCPAPLSKVTLKKFLWPLFLLLLVEQQLTTEASRIGQEIDESDDLESQMPLVPSDGEEVGSLVGNQQLFSDYCIQSRDIVIGDVKRSVNDLVNNLFSLFYRSFEFLNIDSNKLAKAPKIDLDDHEVKSVLSIGNLGTNGINNKPFKLKESPKPEVGTLAPVQGGLGTHLREFPLFRAIWGAISGIKNAIAATVIKKLESFRQMFGLEKLAMAMGGACRKIFAYDDELRSRFSEIKRQLVELDPGVESVEFIHLNCITIRRVMRLKGVCGYTRHLQNPLVGALLGGGNLEFGGGGGGSRGSKSEEWDTPLGVD